MRLYDQVREGLRNLATLATACLRRLFKLTGLLDVRPRRHLRLIGGGKPSLKGGLKSCKQGGAQQRLASVPPDLKQAERSQVRKTVTLMALTTIRHACPRADQQPMIQGCPCTPC